MTLLRFLCWLIIFQFHCFLMAVDGVVSRFRSYFQKNQYVRKGSCRQTGSCCQAIGIELTQEWVRKKRVRSVVQAYFQFVYRFKYRGFNEQMLHFSCAHLNAEGKCSIYPFRPLLCRQYPQVHLWSHDLVSDACGYYFEPVSRKNTFQDVLQKKRGL